MVMLSVREQKEGPGGTKGAAVGVLIPLPFVLGSEALPLAGHFTLGMWRSS